MFYLKYRRALCAVALSGMVLAAGTGTVHAQAQDTGAQNDDAAQTAPADVVSPDLIERALAGDNDALAALQAFLRGTDGKSPEAVTRRATALIAQIGREKKDASTDSLLTVIDRIASSAINMVSGSQIVRIGVDTDFVPTRAVLAWDFGPADGPIAPGFERVLPNDGRIGGAALDGLRRPADNELLNDGIAGVERIEVDLPDGEYRVILMTQNLGDNRLMANPFGSRIAVNGAALTVNQPSPDDWVKDAVFSNRGLQNTAGQTAQGPGAKGFISGDLGKFDPARIQRQAGGAIIIQAVVRGGKLIIELGGFNNARSYLTGLMVEPAAETSDLVLSREAAETLAPPELRLALEENILAAAADVLADVDPAQGDPELVELPEPILDPEELASTAS
tara:strand:+ start:1554 stop:2732 length:1179 start_codon:yes stop_codon:yes gene_type:complete